MTLVDRIRTWWYRANHPGTCDWCQKPMRDDLTGRYCSESCEFDHEYDRTI